MFTVRLTEDFEPRIGNATRSPRSFNCSIGMRTKRYALLAFALVVALSGSVAAWRTNAGAPALVRPDPARSSVQLYSRYCASCHGRDGAAKTRKAKTNHARNLRDAEWQDRVSDERIFNSVVNGKGKMPGYGKKLSETEINELVTYVRRLRK